MSQPQQQAPKEVRWQRRAGGGAKKLFAWVAILGLAAFALALLADRNARSFTLAREDGALVVKKGIFFPVGSRTYAPADPRLAKAYAPMAAPPGWAPAEGQRLEGREELDQALFELLTRWGREDVSSGGRERIARGLRYVERAELLAGISAAQREELETLRAEAGFFEGRELLERSAEELRRARESLARTARSASAHAGDASEALRQLDEALESLHRTARALAGTGPAGPGGAADAEPPPQPEPAAGAAEAPSGPRPPEGGAEATPPGAAPPGPDAY